MKLPSSLQHYIQPLAEESRRRDVALYLVGGCVRDWMLGRPTKDLDFVSESDPEPLAHFCRRRWRARMEKFDRFGTIRVHTFDDFRLDFVRARSESYPRPAALPVVRPGTLLEDLARRDFTINAMAMVINGSGEIIDPHGGREDLSRKTLRVLHDRSFQDDPTRIFRAARFLCRFGLKFDAQTEILRRSAVAENLCGLLSRERVRGELVRILDEKNPAAPLRQLKTWKLTKYFHPSFSWPAGLNVVGGCWERLGVIALHMGSKGRAKSRVPLAQSSAQQSAEGRDFVQSLHLERSVSQSLLEALEVHAAQSSLRASLSPLARRVLEIAFPKLPSAALEPLLVDGGDLQALGLESGPEFKTLLEHAARSQWSGKFRTRDQALTWLRRRVVVRKGSK